jgi:hypothetical protein
MIPEGISRHKILIISLLVIAFVVMPIVYFLYTSVQRGDKTQVTLVALPENAEITLNDKVVRPGVLFLEPGQYTLKAKKDGFASYESREIVEKDAKMIVISLSAVSDDAQKYADQNKQKYLELEGKAGQAAQEDGVSFRTKNPIVNALPYSNFLYQIGYQRDLSDPTGNSIIVTIDANAGYRNAAIRQIRALGFDPAQLKIMFRDYESPFENE